MKVVGNKYNQYSGEVYGTAHLNPSVWRELFYAVTGLLCFFKTNSFVANSWIEVDDLEDLSKLEHYVGESEVMLLLLSKGYFLSISTPQPAARTPD